MFFSGVPINLPSLTHKTVIKTTINASNLSLENSVTCVKPAFNGRFSHQVTYPEGYKFARHRWNLIRLVDFRNQRGVDGLISWEKNMGYPHDSGVRWLVVIDGYWISKMDDSVVQSIYKWIFMDWCVYKNINLLIQIYFI